MLSISRGMSAGQAGGYFSREDYYLKEDALERNSCWYGKGAEVLGLRGPVEKEKLHALSAGRDPGTGVQLVVPGYSREGKTGDLIKKHRAGNDATFSAPKSVSIGFVLGVEGIKDAHDAAVAAVLEHMDGHYALYRSPNRVRNGGLLAASFDHATSRNLDPQLHSHVFILNAVLTGEGDWRANWIKPVFQDQKSLGLLYRQALAHELRLRDFPLRVTDRSQMFFELEGIDPRLVEHFSSRRKAIEKQVRNWQKAERFYGVSHAKLYEMAALETRDVKREVTRQDVERIFEKGFAACGTTMPEVKHELEMSRTFDPPVPEYSAPEVVLLAADRLVDKEAVIDRARLLDQAVLISGGQHDIGELNGAVDGGAKGVLRLGPNGKGREYYTTSEIRDVERENLKLVRELSPFKSVTTLEEVRAFVKNEVEKDGFRVSEGQMAQIEKELTGSAPVGAAIGVAGSGKTLAPKIIERFNSEVLRPRGEKHYSINIAFTGKAAQELQRASGRPAWTVDGFLNSYFRGDVRLEKEKADVPRVEAGQEKIVIPAGAQVVLRVDEVSFVGARQARHLLQVVRELQYQGVQTKLQLSGDTRQLQAIQAGDLFRQVLELEKEGVCDVARLNEIRRQRDPELLEVTKTLNREGRLPGENAREALELLKEKGEVFELPHEEMVAAAVKRYRTESMTPAHDQEKAALGEKQSVLLVTSTNADRILLNREIREARIRDGEIGEGVRTRVLVPVPEGSTADCYREGDLILFSGYRGGDGRMQRWGARLNTKGTVSKIDPDKNRVAVTYIFALKDKAGREVTRTVTKNLPAAEMVGKTTAYREDERFFSAGDRIVALKNDRTLHLQNGSLGVIRSIEANGVAQVEFEGRQVALDLNRYSHLDHAYAVTIHKSQGSTVEHSIWFAPVRTGGVERGEFEEGVPRESFGRASYNAFNVAVTRAQYGATVFTNSLADLAREVERVDVKSSSLDREATNKVVPPAVVKLPNGEDGARKEVSEVAPPEVLRRVPGKEKEVMPERTVWSVGEAALGRTEPSMKHPGFDRGAALKSRLDELARVSGHAVKLPDDILPKVRGPALPGRTITVAASRLPVKEIDHGFGK
ncbi:MobF family relaxase [Geomonas paludis]|uniref:TrwC relaxase domain-containing protein n=1 Tax=Geomonas paludis TaxID=2740185 RepID=A0A6V8MT54_9BACT|nr:MobF family relaxase [Geomonas paludis]GFO63161.1 hypothetical protein GMPD_10800 [Geomonas paludis]